jgi:hypothetical protein
MSTGVKWIKSTYCADGACVEVAAMGEMIAVRDGKNVGIEPLKLSLREWRDFVDGINAGDFAI